MEPIWTAEDKQAALRKEVTIFSEKVGESFFEQRQLPTDIHRVEYVIEGEIIVDAVRAYKMADIFDVYYDKITPLNGTVSRMTNGYGTIKPKLWTADS